MPLNKLQFRPGINRETTSYSNEGGWFDMDKVRFRFGFPEKIGGWDKVSTNYFLGSCRALHSWVALDGSTYVGMGTNQKYYINEGGGFNDITPIRLTTSAGDVTFTASANTLAAAMAVDDQSLTLTSSTAFPQSGRIKIDSEVMTYAAVSGNDLIGLTRGVNGTTAATHSSSAAVTCATLIVTDINNGVLDGDFVTFSGAVTLGDVITADILNQEYQVTTTIDDDNYQIEARTVSTIPSITGADGLTPTYVFATTSDSGDGGASVIGAYQINTGLDSALVGNGWGAGTWGRGAWGSSTSLAAGDLNLRVWTHDNYGEDLLLNVRDEGIYYWDKTSGLASRAVELSSLPFASDTPQVAKQILISDRDRHIIAFGCDPIGGGGAQDPLLIRFSETESLTDWTPTATNTAGDLRIGSGSEIITAVETRQQILVFTDKSLNAMQYLGPPYTFGMSTVSENITIASPMAAVAVEDNVFWMGAQEFYVYGGAVERIPCTVRDYVFGDFNLIQAEKVFSASNTAFSEVWWFYPSASSTECDRYVVFNYQQQIWYYGTLSRTAWIDRGIETNPIAAGADKTLYFHETGFNDGSTTPSTAMASYIESSQMSIGSGDEFVFMRRVIPDITFRNSTAESPTVTMTLKTRNFPGGPYLQSNTKGVEKTASLPVEQFTEQLFVRLRGRSFAFRIDGDQLDTTWRLGSPRVDVQPDGGR